LIWEEMVANLPATNEILRHLDLMEKLPATVRQKAAVSELRAAYKTELKTRALDRKKRADRDRKHLSSLGISGSAVLAKLPNDSASDSRFPSALAKFRQEFLKSD